MRKPAIRRVRALKMLELLLQGHSEVEIGKTFRLTPRTVRNEMDFLDREGLLQKTEESILSDLQPLAVKVMKKHLEEQVNKKDRTSIDGAKAVLKESLKRASTPRGESNDEATLERWVIERRVKRGEIIEGELAPKELPDVGVSGSAGNPAGVRHQPEPVEVRQVGSGSDDQRKDAQD